MPELRGGSWNLNNNRDDRVVVGEVKRLLRDGDLDFLCVEEAQEYVDNLARIPGYDLFTTRGKGPSERDAGILVRHGLRTRGYGLTRTRTRWPREKTSGLHWPRSFPRVRIEGVTVVSVHMPRAIYAAAYAECWVRLLLLGMRLRRFVMAGDWNKNPSRKGVYSPRLLASATGASVKGSKIDHALYRGVMCFESSYGPSRGSDHEPHLFTIIWEK